MKKAIVLILIAVLLISGLLAGCSGMLKSSGNLETKRFNFSDFTKVIISSAFEFEIMQSDSYDVSITADDNLFEHIQVSKEDETLKIDIKTISILGPVTLKTAIKMPQFHGLDISGATRGTISGFSSKENVDIEESGASSLKLVAMSTGDAKFNISGASSAAGALTASNVNLKVSGASSIELTGTAKNTEVSAEGASHAQLGGFTVTNANVILSGASTGTVNLNGRLDADISGASKLDYIGSPTMGNIKTSGASTLSKK